MTRLYWAVATLLILANSASASLDRRSDRSPFVELCLTINGLPVATADVSPPQQAELNGETQVFLNGQRSDYKQIPPNAVVDRVVLAADGKTIVRIDFATRK
jgi:hypothetical protein